jgi:putative transcriptional regulator
MDLRIVQLRKRKSMTQTRLAELCSTTQQQIAKIENAVVDPQLSTLKRLASALGCEIKDLFYSKAEFLAEIRLVVKESKTDLKKIKILELNSTCYEARGIPSLHPYWSLVEIKNGKVSLLEEKS